MDFEFSVYKSMLQLIGKKKKRQKMKMVKLLRQQVLLMLSKTLFYQKNKCRKTIRKSKTHGLQRFEYFFFPKITLAIIPCFAKSFYYAKEQFHTCQIFLSESKYASKVLGFLQFRIYLGFGVLFNTLCMFYTTTANKH